jgi:hypothetical protein
VAEPAKDRGLQAMSGQAVLTHRERCLKDEDRKTWQGVLDKLNIKPE